MSVSVHPSAPLRRFGADDDRFRLRVPVELEGHELIASIGPRGGCLRWGLCESPSELPQDELRADADVDAAEEQADES